MTPGGWIVMFLSVGSATSLLLWCIYKVLTTSDESHIHGFEFETPDEHEEHREED